jgi:hypothetical protein
MKPSLSLAIPETLARALGLLFLLWGALELWALGRRRRRARRRESNLRHIAGPQPWWKTPPSDGPEGDH